MAEKREQPGTPPDADATYMASPTSESVMRFGPYRLLQLLGEGGMGQVWLADQLHPVHRQVAIKVIKAGMDSTQVIARFEAERQALALMDHPAIAKVFDGGTTPEGRPYFAMELVRGEPITTYCDRQRLPLGDRLELFIQVCEGVQHAHQKGIIHRDLKPSNVLVSLQGDRAVPRIIDFGVAKAMSQPMTERPFFTELGVLIGTPEYMSPEQAEMSVLDVDTRSDVYSLGVILYELVSGFLPFDQHALRQAGLEELRRTIREAAPARPSTRVTPAAAGSSTVADNRRIEPGKLASRLRGDIDWITLKALEKDRTRRYQTANALALDVRRHLANEPVAAGPPSTTYRIGKFVRRHRFGVAAGTVFVALLIAFSAVMTLQAQRIARERDRANREAVAAKQVADFLVGLFNVADPSETRGNTLTAREILATGARNIEHDLQNQPDVQARLKATIGQVETNLGLYAEAGPLLEQAVAAQTGVLGRDHIETLSTLHQLANLYWYQGKLTQAESLYLEVIEQRSRLVGKDHPTTLQADYDLASLYILQKRWNEAEPLIRRTLEAQRRALGPDHPDTMSTLELLQNMYFAQERYIDAEPIAVDVMAFRRKTLGLDHPATLTSMHNLATIYWRLRRYGEAEQLFLAAIEGKRRVSGTSHPSTSRSLQSLARMYQDLGRYGEAEPLILASYEGYRAAFGQDDERTRTTVKELVDLYVAWDRKEQAANWRAKLRATNAAQR
jgi:serine/threonine protein kinase/tetratricopeptide (TPR) repeat protein